MGAILQMTHDFTDWPMNLSQYSRTAHSYGSHSNAKTCTRKIYPEGTPLTGATRTQKHAQRVRPMLVAGQRNTVAIETYISNTSI